MNDDPTARAPEPQPDEKPEQPAAPRPAETPSHPAAQAKTDLRAILGGAPPKPVQPKRESKPEPKRPAAKPAPAVKATARAQRKAERPAQEPPKKAASKPGAAKGEPAPPKPPKPPAPAKPARALRRKTDPAPKPPAEKLPSKTANKIEPAAARGEPLPPTKPQEVPAAPKPASPVVPVPPAIRPVPAAPTAIATPIATARPPVQRAAGLAEPLDAIGRRIIGRLERTEQALSPWTQQSLRLQQPALPGHTPAPPGTAQDAAPTTRSPAQARGESSAGSLARRLQRQERQGAAGTFGRLARGVERAERFANGIVAHFPLVAAKYEPPPAPEAGTASTPPAASGPTFTYYPEGAASTASRQPTMTAAEVLQRFGGTTSTPPVQRTPAAPPASAPPKTSPPASQAPRDPRRVRRFSRVEELSPNSATPAEPPAPPEPRPAQRKPGFGPPMAVPPDAPSTPAETRAETPRPRRRPSHSEEVTPTQREPPAIQRTPSEPAKPAAPSPATADQPGPLRWDHLTNLPPSMQRQLERVQQQLAEQSGLVGPPVSMGNTERPFFPRNPNPPPADQDRPTLARLASAPDEPEAPVAFGPDLQPRPAGVQRQVQSPTASQVPGEPTPAVQQPQAAARPQMASLSADTTQPPIGAEADVTEETSPEPASTPLGQDMPVVVPPEREPVVSQPEQAPSTPTKPAMLSDESEPAGASDSMAVQRSPEPDLPAATPLAELTLRQPGPAQPSEEAPVVQHRPAEPADRLRQPKTGASPTRPTAEPPAVQRQTVAQTRPVEPSPSPTASMTEPRAVPRQPAEPADQVGQAEPSTSPAAPMVEPPVTPMAEIEPAARLTRQPLILRQPAAPEDTVETEAPAEQVAPLAEPKQAVEPQGPTPSAPGPLPDEMETPSPGVPASPLTDQPMVLRKPPAAEVKPAALVQRTPAATRGQAEPIGAPAPAVADNSAPETPVPSSRSVMKPVEMEAFAPPEPAKLAEPQSDSARPAPEETPGGVPPSPRVPGQVLPAGEMPPRPSIDLPATQPDSWPVVSAPEPARPAAIQRQAERQPAPTPALEMPLRQPTVVPEPEPRRQTTERGPELSLGSQVYSRGLKDVQMPVFGGLATNLRGSLQRKPAAQRAPEGPFPFGPAAIASPARTASGPTPVLPQARIQRLDNPDERTPWSAARPSSLTTQQQDVLPLAPPGPAPENPPTTNETPNRTWRSARPGTRSGDSLQQPRVTDGDGGNGQSPPTTGGTWQRATPRINNPNLNTNLPLAPVIARNGGNGQSTTSTTDDTQEEGNLDETVSDEEENAPETPDENAAMEEIDLDDLAGQLLPYIKRLMAVERERHDPAQ